MDLRRSYAAAAFAFTLALLLGCQNKNTPELKPSNPKINSSFSLKPSRTQGANVCIKSAALEKHFLLFSQARSSETAGQWMLYAPQIIFFKRSGSQMGLFEANLTRVYDDVMSEKLLQTFPVTAEDAENVCFDWNYGLQTIVVADSMGYTDPELAKRLLDGRSPIAKVIASFVDDARIENNELHFRQMSRVRQSVMRVQAKIEAKKLVGKGAMSEEDTAVTIEMRIRPYDFNKNFPILKSKFDRGYGYFTNYTTSPGENTPYEIAQRWDTAPEKGLIKFRLSKNIPTDLLPAVKEGLDYWNRVAGKKILDFEENVDPKSGMQERSVMVHWVDWKDAGFAYAGYQADPLTGEILQGQIFLTSFWRAYGESYEQLGGTMSSMLVAGPEGARKLPGCRYHHDAFRAWDSIPMTGRSVGADSALSLMIKSVVSHEAGHVVGLRHNFAASFYSGKSADEIAEKSRKYLKDGTIEPVATVTSVMDYPQAFDELMMAKYIATDVLEYDKKAFAWGYANGPAEERLQFCTDEHLRESVGCAAYDSSKNPFLSQINMGLINRSRSLWTDHSGLMGLIYPNLRDRNDVEDVLNASAARAPSAVQIPQSTLTGINALYAADDLKIHSVKDLTNWEHPEQAEKAKAEALELLKSEIGFVKAFDLAFPWSVSMNSPDTTYWDRQMTAVFEHAKFKTGMTRTGVPYALTDKEAERVQAFMAFTMKDTIKHSFTAFEAFLPGQQLTIRNGQISLNDVVFKESAGLKADMPALVDRVLALMKYSTESKSFTTGGETFSIPVRAIEPRLFASWSRLFKTSHNKNAEPAHLMALLVSLKKDLAPVFQAVGVASPETLKIEELKTKKAAVEASWPPDLRQWVDGELARIESFEKI